MKHLSSYIIFESKSIFLDLKSIFLTLEDDGFDITYDTNSQRMGKDEAIISVSIKKYKTYTRKNDFHSILYGNGADFIEVRDRSKFKLSEVLDEVEMSIGWMKEHKWRNNSYRVKHSIGEKPINLNKKGTKISNIESNIYELNLEFTQR